MFGSGKLRELEVQLSSVKNKLESALKEKTDQVRGKEREDQDTERGKKRIGYDLETERITDSICIAFAVVLRGKNADPRRSTENDKVEDKDQLVSDGHAGKRVRTHPSDHEIVQQVYEIGNTVLHHHRDGDQQKPRVEALILFGQIRCHVSLLQQVYVFYQKALSPTICACVFIRTG